VCDGERIVTDPVYGVRVCLDTGEVLEENLIDDGPDWRAYSYEESVERAHAGAPLTPALTNMGVGATVSKRPNAGGQQKATGFKRAVRDRVKPPPRSGKLLETLSTIYKLAQQLEAPKAVIETAGMLAQEIRAKGIDKDLSPEAVATVSLHEACKTVGYPATLRDIVSLFDESERGRIWRQASRLVSRLFQLGLVSGNALKPEDFVPSIAGKLGLSPEIQRSACDILAVAKRRGVAQVGNPKLIATASIYLACKKAGLPVSYPQLSKTLGVSEGAIGKWVKTIKRALAKEGWR